MSEKRYVYVVEQGCYSDRGVVGVYASAVAAMAAHPVPARPARVPGEREGGWRLSRDSEPDAQYDNGLDWNDAKDITRYEVEGA